MPVAPTLKVPSSQIDAEQFKRLAAIVFRAREQGFRDGVADHRRASRGGDHDRRDGDGVGLTNRDDDDQTSVERHHRRYAALAGGATTTPAADDNADLDRLAASLSG